MLNVCCLCTGTAYGPEYVEILYSMVRRNLAGDFRGRFVVFTDNPSLFTDMAGVQVRTVPADLKGWWGKLYLFSADAFPAGERVLYFDLDTVITGPLDDIARYDGPFAILRDVYRPNGLQSSVMAWEAGLFTTSLWDAWNASGRPAPAGGDQEIIERYFDGSLFERSGQFGHAQSRAAQRPTGISPVEAQAVQAPTDAQYGLDSGSGRKSLSKADLWQELFPKQFRSYKVDCQDFVPRGASVVFFHGFPRPHQAGGWVKEVWKVADSALSFALNVKEDQVRANIQHALTKPKWIQMRDGITHPAIIVGGGPSLSEDLWRIRGYQLSGAVVFATNNTYAYLIENGITPNAHVMHDAREANCKFVPPIQFGINYAEPICYYASQCHPSVLDAAGDRLVCWHPHSEACLDVIKDDPKGPTMVSGGSTVGLNAIAVAYILGHRQFRLFGFDSCYTQDEHHAYSQPLNDGELVLDYEWQKEKFRCAPWMIQQAEQFAALANQLAALGCEIFVYGKGLIPHMVAHAQPHTTAADLRAASLLEWMKGIENPVGAEIGVFAGELSQRLLQRPDLTLYLVDSWSADHDPQYAASGDFHASLSQAKQDYYCRLTHQMVSFAGERAKLMRMASQQAAQFIPDQSLDFVFIDADHSYEGCRADILTWMPKVKAGGILSGHDYENTNFPKFGVKRAVDELFQEVTLGQNFTWCVRR